MCVYGGFSSSTLGKEPGCQRIREAGVQSLDWDGPLEEDMGTRCSILAGESVDRRPGGPQFTVSQRVRHN